MRGKFAILLVFIWLSGTSQVPELDNFIGRIKAKSYQSDVKLLKKVVAASHKELLRNYKAYSDVAEVFLSGTFDCLSGTMIMCSIFDRLNLSYRVYETNYHIFLLVSTSEGEVIVETTDKKNGLVTNKREIENRIKSYREFGQDLYLSKLSIFKEVSKEQMQGLALFNKAVSNFLQKDLISSFNFLLKAKESYDNPRISEFSKVLIRQITASDLQQSLKEDLISKLRRLNGRPAQLAAM